MKVRNRSRWSDIDDPYYYTDRYNYSAYNCSCFGNPWTPTTYWNNHYNPYYLGTVIMSPQTTIRYSGPRTFNLNTYNNTALTNGTYSNPKFTGSGSGSTYNTNNNTYSSPRNSSSNNGTNSGNILRDIFGSSNSKTSGSSSGSNTPSTSTPSAGSSSGSSGSSAPVRRF